MTAEEYLKLKADFLTKYTIKIGNPHTAGDTAAYEAIRAWEVIEKALVDAQIKDIL